MKNMKKLVALFAATTMAMSLSVSAFAASYADGTLTLEAADFLDTGAQKTMMAYVVDGTTDAEGNAFTASTIPAYNAENHAMIALNQDANLTGDVLVDASKVAAGKTIVIKTSGSNGSVNTILLAQEVTPVTYNVTYVNVADTTGYPITVVETTTIKAFAESLTVPTKAADENYTYAFAGWYTDAELNVPATSEESVSTIAVEGVITLYAKYDATAIPQDKTYKITGYVDDAYATVTVGETTVNVGSNGAFEIAELENGTYSVVVKAPGALNRTLSATISDADVALSTESDKITLVFGATVENAESIGLADLLEVKANYNVSDGEEGYILNLDFDRSGDIGLADLLEVKANYNMTIADAYGN